MKLTVWIAEQEADSPCYNIVARTRKDALAQIEKHSFRDYSAPKKVVIGYKDAFELFNLLTSEGGGRHTYY